MKRRDSEGPREGIELQYMSDFAKIGKKLHALGATKAQAHERIVSGAKRTASGQSSLATRPEATDKLSDFSPAVTRTVRNIADRTSATSTESEDQEQALPSAHQYSTPTPRTTHLFKGDKLRSSRGSDASSENEDELRDDDGDFGNDESQPSTSSPTANRASTLDSDTRFSNQGTLRTSARTITPFAASSPASSRNTPSIVATPADPDGSEVSEESYTYGQGNTSAISPPRQDSTSSELDSVAGEATTASSTKPKKKEPASQGQGEIKLQASLDAEPLPLKRSPVEYQDAVYKGAKAIDSDGNPMKVATAPYLHPETDQVIATEQKLSGGLMYDIPAGLPEGAKITVDFKPNSEEEIILDHEGKLITYSPPQNGVASKLDPEWLKSLQEEQAKGINVTLGGVSPNRGSGAAVSSTSGQSQAAGQNIGSGINVEAIKRNLISTSKNKASSASQTSLRARNTSQTGKGSWEIG